jgi:phosphopantothenoylcysteine decarboxylase/phosphopantothenate--cysteine ligase
MRHIRLSREADLIVIAPASANILAQMANGLAEDLATTTILAADKRALIAPAMNHKMWDNPATRRNIKTLKSDGHSFIGPEEGDMACGEYGMGRMSEPETIFTEIQKLLK